MAASLTAHCARCGKQIHGFNKLKPAACPNCWSELSFGTRKRRRDGIFRCFGCHCLCHTSFKFCEICGLSTYKGLKDLAVIDKNDVRFRNVGFQTDFQGVDKKVDTSDFKETMEISGCFDDDDMLEDMLNQGSRSGSGAETPPAKKKCTRVEAEAEDKVLSGAESDECEDGTLDDSGICNSPT